MRGVRVRWFGTGMIIGAVAGMLITLGVSILAVAAGPLLPSQGLTEDPDITVSITEDYLNREVQRGISGGYSTGINGLTLTGLTMDLKPNNQMHLQPTFKASVPFFGEVSVNAAVTSQISLQDGKLTSSMVGDPQLGNLDIPLDLLPFDLKGGVNDTVNNINNEILIARINQSLQEGFGESNFAIEGLATDENLLTVQLKQR